MLSYHHGNKGQQQQQEFEKVEDYVEYLPVDGGDTEVTVGKILIPDKRANKGQSVTLKIQQTPSSGLSTQSTMNVYYSNKQQQNANQSQYSQPAQLNISQSNQDGFSPLGSYYQNHSHAKLVYKKDKNIGTAWIGQKQYWASVFASYQMIHKLQFRRLFGHTQCLNPNDQSTNSTPSFKPASNTLQFDSDFQSGNLFAVYKVGQLQYELILQNDTNTKGNTQWFYFRITNVSANKSIKLNIVNLRKSQSLFSDGMLPCIYSTQNEKRTGEKWIRKGTEVKYFRNSHLLQGHSKKYYYTLSFVISTQYQNDTIHVAQSYPYTYRQLNLWIDSLFKINYSRGWLTKTTVVNDTLGGNKIQALTIKETKLLQPQKHLKLSHHIHHQIQHRPLIILLARQHPGQTPSSFVMEGIVQFLLAKQKDAEYLRKNFEIIAIPMLNPDGVQAGNYRTNLLGVDMNRRWDCTIKQVSNTKQFKQQAYQIVYIKRYLQSLTKNRQIAYVIDLHGHSRKLHSFFYGNVYPQGPLQTKMFPYICSRLSSIIKFQDCTFNIGEDKRSTARVQLFNMLKSPNIYTFETSFFGYVKKKEKQHFTVQDYRMLGQVIGKAMYICERAKQSDVQTCDRVFWDRWGKQIKTMNESGDNNSKREEDGEGSDSCPQEFQIQQGEREQLVKQFTNIFKNQQSLLSTQTLSLSNKQIRQKITRRQMILATKQPMKGLRQMQVLEIAKINSVFPNDLLALAPNGFCLNNVSDIVRGRANKKSNNYNKILTKRHIGVQTSDCRLIKVYELCKFSQQGPQIRNVPESLINNVHSQILSINQTPLDQLYNQKQEQLTKNTQPIVTTYYSQKKSQLIFRPKSKTTVSNNNHKSNINSSTVTSTRTQHTLRTLSTLSAFRSKSIHERQLYENARHFSAIKKSTDIRKNFKKVFAQFQLGVMMAQGGQINKNIKKIKNMVNQYVQTVIMFSAGNDGIGENSQTQDYQMEQNMLQSAQSFQYTPKKKLQSQSIQQSQFKYFKAPTENYSSSFQTNPTPTPTKTKSFFHKHSQQQQQISSEKQHQSLLRSKLHSASQKYWTVGDNKLEMSVNNNNSKYNKSAIHKTEFQKSAAPSKSIFNKNEFVQGRLYRGDQGLVKDWNIKINNPM